MIFFRHVAFDLDDTILDTSGALIPAAARRAVEAMLVASKPAADTMARADIEAMLTKRTEIQRVDPRAEIWLKLAHGNREIADIGRRAFFTHPIEILPKEALRPTPGALDILKWASERAAIHLVTSGDATTQTKKIDRLEIAGFFDSVQIVETPHSRTGAKNEAFRKIQERFPDAAASDFLSIGNRVDTDLSEAKVLGWKTAWVRYGEHANLTPAKPEEIPDFEVASLADLLSIWRQQFRLDAGRNPKDESWKS